MESDPRHIALRILLHWHRASHTLDHAIHAHSRQLDQLETKDRNFCNALIFGVLRQRESMDRIIGHFSKSPIKKIKPKPLYLLRIGIYQIVHMDRIPDFAAIDTTVEIGKKTCGKPTAGFINAVLRKAATRHHEIELPDKDRDPADFIGIEYSLPLWLAKRWLDRYGFDPTVRLCEQISTIPSITLRTNTLKTDRATLAGQLSEEAGHVLPTSFARNGLRFSNPASAISDLTTFQQGWFQIQDEAAQIVTEFMDPRSGERILDACAGLGGKTGHIAQLMDNSGSVTALDIASKKLVQLEQEARRLGYTNIRTRAADLTRMTIRDFDTFFDRVLVDAPCTGLGVIQRNPDTKWKRTIHDITRLCSRQKKILNAAANLVKPGGVLVYAVCSCEPEENEHVIQAFLSKRKDYTIDREINGSGLSELMTPDGFIKTYPQTNHMDGFFAARLKRKQTS